MLSKEIHAQSYLATLTSKSRPHHGICSFLFLSIPCGSNTMLFVKCTDQAAEIVFPCSYGNRTMLLAKCAARAARLLPFAPVRIPGGISTSQQGDHPVAAVIFKIFWYYAKKSGIIVSNETERHHLPDRSISSPCKGGLLWLQNTVVTQVRCF